MLVLSRNIGQWIVINNNIYVGIQAIEGNQVKLLFDAPHNIPIHREEIQRRIDKEAANDERV